MTQTDLHAISKQSLIYTAQADIQLINPPPPPAPPVYRIYKCLFIQQQRILHAQSSVFSPPRSNSPMPKPLTCSSHSESCHDWVAVPPKDYIEFIPEVLEINNCTLDLWQWCWACIYSFEHASSATIAYVTGSMWSPEARGRGVSLTLPEAREGQQQTPSFLN